MNPSSVSNDGSLVDGVFVALRNYCGSNRHFLSDQRLRDRTHIFFRDEQALCNAECRCGRGAELWHSVFPLCFLALGRVCVAQLRDKSRIVLEWLG